MNKLISSSRAQELKEIIIGSREVVLTAHVRPDGDAIGSTVGLAFFLKNLGKNVTVILPDAVIPTYRFLEGTAEILAYSDDKEKCCEKIDNADLIICCDFNTPKRLGEMGEKIENAQATKILIDHHPEPDDFTDLVFSYPEMSSTCELAYRVIEEMGMEDKVDFKSAEALLMGLITDSRNFTVNCKYPDIYEILMRLLEKGARKEKIIKETLNTKSFDSIKLESFALLEKLEIFPEHKAALITLSQDELKRFNYQKGDTEGLVNRPLEIRGVLYSFFMREDADCVKISARSVNDFPVSLICKELFGGGGHVQAAGGEFYGPLSECRELFLTHIKEYDRFADLSEN